MRAAIASVLTALCVTSVFADEPVHRFGPQDRYAGCLFGDMVPLLRRGYSRQGALATASRRCEALSAKLSKREVEEAADYVNFSIDIMERP